MRVKAGQIVFKKYSAVSDSIPPYVLSPLSHGPRPRNPSTYIDEKTHSSLILYDSGEWVYIVACSGVYMLTVRRV